MVSQSIAGPQSLKAYSSRVSRWPSRGIYSCRDTLSLYEQETSNFRVTHFLPHISTMGAAISVVKDAIKDMDGAKQKEGEIKEALDNMQQMAQDQLDIFYERIG